LIDVIKSINFDQHQIIKDIIKLHCPDGIEVDTTYSKGLFYKNGVEAPKYKFDKIPLFEDVKQFDGILPFQNSSVNSIMFDPPFAVGSGKSLDKNIEGRNIIPERFSLYPSVKAMFTAYENELKEYYRVLKQNGVLIFKCQDTVSGGKNYFTHVWVMNKAHELGFYPKDLFVLCAKNRIISPKHKNQQHARKFHSYFWVFVKQDSKVKY